MSGGDKDPEPPLRGKLARMLPDPAPAVAPAALPLEPRSGERATPAAACALGVCDGSGWIVEDDTATPCECRGRRIAKARTRGVSGVIPRRYEGVSFDRPPVSDMARSPGIASTVGAVRDYCEHDRRPDRRRATGSG